MEVWTREQTSTFISLLREHPCLYDTLNPHFLNRVQKNNAFSLILDGMLHIHQNLSVKCLRKKLRTLQTQLSRERGKVLASRRSGAGADDTYQPTLWCYDELAFLIHTNDNPETSANFEITSQLENTPIQLEEETAGPGHEHRDEDLSEVLVFQEPEEELHESESSERTKRRKCAEELQQQASKLMQTMEHQRRDLEARERQQQTEEAQQQQTLDQRHDEIKSMLQKIIDEQQKQQEWQKKQDEKTRLLLECQLELFRVLQQQHPRDNENQTRLQTEIIEALHEEKTEWFG